MAKRAWLLKTEPEGYGWEDLTRERRAVWDGVRNYQARNNLREMRRGDLALVYHSGSRPEVVGLARVIRAAYPDPTTADDRWVAVDIEPVEALRAPVSLAAIKSDPELGDMTLLRNSRLSVVPLRDAEFERILDLGGTKSPSGG
jgi:predicted RNA-binding protein with PUA-like domain